MRLLFQGLILPDPPVFPKNVCCCVSVTVPAGNLHSQGKMGKKTETIKKNSKEKRWKRKEKERRGEERRGEERRGEERRGKIKEKKSNSLPNCKHKVPAPTN
ncbi:hypothetical protein llap_22519 [Limosa lapponica baueri]|uniref:Uncharacterized protein n=1 Tax=Limosa lapponica baueri TaxID=1758121 RepID=A0A2I0T063_LIMLA|nr:hypothetical protein llap_22519 [Limosa lapponica baueri]